MQEECLWSLGQEDPLEKEMATHSSILAWGISWTEEPVGHSAWGCKRVGHNWMTKQQQLVWNQTKAREEMFTKDLELLCVHLEKCYYQKKGLVKFWGLYYCDRKKQKSKHKPGSWHCLCHLVTEWFWPNALIWVLILLLWNG